MAVVAERERSLLLTTGMALARAITVDRALQEAGHQLLHALSCDTVAIALRDEETRAPRLAHHAGVDGEPGRLPPEISADWDAALDGDVLRARSTEGGLQLTAPIPASSGPAGVLTVVAGSLAGIDRDAGRRAELERLVAGIAAQLGTALDRANQLAHLDRRRRVETSSQVAAGIAHELRNPLFGISSAAQLLRFRVQEDPVIEKNVGRILREVERLNTLTSALLEYGRPVPPRLASVDPDAIWDDVLALQRGGLESRALRVIRTRPEPPHHLPGDAEQLAQLCAALLANAIQAAPEGTDLTLTSATLPAGGWRCRLHNTGPAIPADVLPRVFDVFFSTRPGGTGIGLALAQRIAEAHGGRIWLESREGAGTTAVLTLPDNAG